MKTDLAIKLGGLSLRNPFIVASGVLGISSKLMARAYNSGAGAVVTKSIGLEEREGYSGPNIVVGDGWVLNAMGLPNPGVEYSLKEIVEAKKMGVSLIVSVYGFTVDDYVSVAEKVFKAGLTTVELNLSCPNVKGTGEEIGQNPEMVKKVVGSVRDCFKGYVIVKLTPNVGDIKGLGKAAEESGADALTAVNTLKGMTIDVTTRRPILSACYGGVSGPALKPIALRCVYDLHQTVSVPVIGCGGINSWEDAVEFFLAGANAVQAGTALLYEDFKVFKELESGVRRYLESNGYSRVSEIVGLAHKTES